MRFESARFAVEQLGVEKREDVRAELREAAPIVGEVFALGVRKAALPICEIASACKMSC